MYCAISSQFSYGGGDDSLIHRFLVYIWWNSTSFVYYIYSFLCNISLGFEYLNEMEHKGFTIEMARALVTIGRPETLQWSFVICFASSSFYKISTCRTWKIHIMFPGSCCKGWFTKFCVGFFSSNFYRMIGLDFRVILDFSSWTGRSSPIFITLGWLEYFHN